MARLEAAVCHILLELSAEDAQIPKTTRFFSGATAGPRLAKSMPEAPRTLFRLLIVFSLLLLVLFLLLLAQQTVPPPIQHLPLRLHAPGLLVIVFQSRRHLHMLNNHLDVPPSLFQLPGLRGAVG
jgi:hypothetical protein